MSERQTLKFLSQQFDQAGLHPKTKFGQNFLVDLNLIDLIARSASIDEHDVVLEIGTGAGSLTTRMAPKAGHVVTVEIDPDLARVAQQQLNAYDNVTLLQMDALKSKSQFKEDLIQTIQACMQNVPQSRLKLVANLPYNVATPIISNLLYFQPWPSGMVVTIQKELAERIVAKPRTKDYSALSIWIQSQCECEIVRIMPPSVFWPRPKVDSAILKIEPKQELRSRLNDAPYFHATVRAIFLHRRKYLRSALISAMKDQLDRNEVDAVLASQGLGPEARAEELTIEQMISLVEGCRLRSADKATTSPGESS